MHAANVECACALQAGWIEESCAKVSTTRFGKKGMNTPKRSYDRSDRMDAGLAQSSGLVCLLFLCVLDRRQQIFEEESG
jgi:hypothetical protein